MQTLGIVDASLVGISMGGGIALGFVLQSPQQVSRLVLVDSYGLQTAAPAHKLSYLFTRIPLINEMTWYLLKRSRTMTRASLRNIFHNPDVVSDELVDEVYAELKKSGTGRAFISFQRSEVLWNGLRTVYIDRLHEIKVPTLITHSAWREGSAGASRLCTAGPRVDEGLTLARDRWLWSLASAGKAWWV